MTMDECYLDKMCQILKSAIQEILNKNYSELSHWDLELNAYAMVFHDHGETLYVGLKEVVTSHLESKVGLLLYLVADLVPLCMHISWMDVTDLYIQSE